MEERRNSKTNSLKEDDGTVLVPPDGGWGWVVTFSGFLALVIADGINISFGLILAEITKKFPDESAADISWVFSILIGLQMLSGPVVSALSNRFGFRIVVIIGSIFGCLGLAASALASSLVILYITIGVICGCSFGMVWMPCMVAVGLYFEKRRALATGIVMCGTGVGTFIFAPLVAWLLEIYGLNGTFLIMGAIFLNCAVCGSVIRPVKLVRRQVEKPEVDESMKDSKGKVVGGNGISDPAAEDPLLKKKLNVTEKSKSDPVETKEDTSLLSMFKLSLFRSPAFVLICISSFFQLIGMLVPYMYISAHAMQGGATTEAAAFLLSIIGITGTIGKVMWGFFADHPKIHALWMNNLTMTFCGVLIIACPFWDTYEWLATFAALLGLTDSCFFVLRPILLGELLGTENVNNAFGFMFLFCGLASFVGLPLTGHLYDTFGSYEVPFYFAGSAVVFSALLCYPLNCINRRWKGKI